MKSMLEYLPKAVRISTSYKAKPTFLPFADYQGHSSSQDHDVHRTRHQHPLLYIPLKTSNLQGLRHEDWNHINCARKESVIERDNT